MLGSSAGAFRFACLSQSKPVEALTALAESYSTTTYEGKPTPREITESVSVILDSMLTKEGISDIIGNTSVHAHWIVAKSNGLVGSEQKFKQLAGLLASMFFNKINRKYLAKQYERIVFKNPASRLTLSDEYDIPTKYIDFTVDNLKDSLMASGAIPLIMEGIMDISGAGAGMYRDGGIIDYHFDLAVNTHEQASNDGLILYPHFTAQPKAGWFDKSAKRTPNAKNYENVVMVCPTESFVKTLPFNKISDRTDFEKIDAETRIEYWQTLLKQSDVLAEDFRNVVETQDFSKFKPLPF